VPEIAPLTSCSVSITSRMRDSECSPPCKRAFTEGGLTQLYAIDTAQVGATTGVPVAGSYLQLVENQPGGLGIAELPHLDAGPFLSYGIQWIAFGIVAPLGLGYFVYSEIKARRRENAAATSQSSEPVTVEDKLADRYGRRQ
jgi:cytochrome oxidase assembly protein ShyY1